MKLFLFSILIYCSTNAQIDIEHLQEYINSYFSEFDKVEFIIPQKIELKHIEIDYSRKPTHKTNILYLPIFLSKNGKKRSSVLGIEIRLMKSVYSAKRDIQFNTTLRKEEFSYGLKDVTKLRGKFFTNDEEFENFRTKSSIKKDEVLILDLIEKIPAVKSGDKLILEVKKGSVEIHVEAVARQNGKIGELIDVLTANNELIRAKVISPNKVLVE